jgi:hypothetical protein
MPLRVADSRSVFETGDTRIDGGGSGCKSCCHRNQMQTRWKIFLAVALFVVLSVGISLLTMRVQPESKVEAYKKLLREKGEKLAISELLPPPVPAESNSVNAVEDAFRLFVSGSEKIPAAMRMIAPGKALVGWSQPDVRGFDNSGDFTNSWDEFTAEVAADRPAIELLHQVLERPRLDFQLDYKKGFALLLPHLAPLKRSAQMLETAAVCNLHAGDPGAAATNILTLLALVQRNAAEGFLISHLVRIAMTAIAVAPTWELLQATNVTDAQLAAVQKGWEQMDFLSDATNVYVLERTVGMDTIEKSRATHEEFEKIFGLSSFMSSSSSSASGGWGWEAMTEKPRYAVAEVMWRSSWSYADELRTLQSEQIILETLRTMQTNQSQFYKADYDAMNTRLSSLGITNAGAAFFRALEIPDLSEMFGGNWISSSVRKTMQMETADRVVVTAIALKRFQVQHGKWPATLTELVPEFFSSVPIDPYAGTPLHYHPKADGTYLLYSVGDNGKDDGGDPTNSTSGGSNPNYSWQNLRARDWVWPQPATAAEIQNFHEHPPK